MIQYKNLNLRDSEDYFQQFKKLQNFRQKQDNGIWGLLLIEKVSRKKTLLRKCLS